MAKNNTHQYPDHFPRRANMHVKDMQYSADVDTNGFVRMELGQPVAASTTGIMDAVSIASALVRSSAGLEDHEGKMGRYGRNVTIALSGAGTPTITVYGIDYLGQPMAETFTAAGASAVAGKKAFKEVQGVTSGAVAATTLNIGFGNVLGLPYAIGQITDAYVDNVAPSAGTAVVAIQIAQTATTGDPRGTYTPASGVLPDGSRDIVLVGFAIEGDYHGLPHFAG